MIQGTTDKPPLPATAPTVPLSAERRGWVSFSILSAFLVLAFSVPLYQLVLHALNNSIHSHVLLIPFICGYLIWQVRSELPLPDRSASVPAIILSAFLALCGLGAVGFWVLSSDLLSPNDRLSFLIFAFCSLFAAAAIFFLGEKLARAITFPLAFFFFLTPLPDKALELLEIASQHASAEVYSWMMNLSGATYYREARTFVLPNLTIVVAQECSGIRSSLVLFLTSLIAGQMFFRTFRSKLLLALAVFPLGICRNAFRIYILSMASAHWDKSIIDSPLHHRGGPIFFALSLIPLFLFLLWLRNTETRQKTKAI